MKMAEIQGAIIVGGGIQVVLGYLGLIGKLLRYIGPITIAPTIALIGLALFPFGVAKVGANWLLGGTTVLLMILFSQVLRKKHRSFELFRPPRHGFCVDIGGSIRQPPVCMKRRRTLATST